MTWSFRSVGGVSKVHAIIIANRIPNQMGSRAGTAKDGCSSGTNISKTRLTAVARPGFRRAAEIGYREPTPASDTPLPLDHCGPQETLA
jgi:hypothetical protein